MKLVFILVASLVPPLALPQVQPAGIACGTDPTVTLLLDETVAVAVRAVFFAHWPLLYF